MRQSYSISVCIPIYFKEQTKTIEKCLESLLNQTYMPTEIVCSLDDPSTPEIEAVIDEWANQTDVSIKKCYTKRGSGLGAVLKTGIENCSCEFIARMDADDFSKPNRFEQELRFLVEHPDIDVVGSDIAEFSDDPNHIESYRRVPAGDAECKTMLKTRDPINHMTAMFRRASILKAGNYNSEMHSCEDTYLWTAFYAHGLNFANIKENLVLVHAGRAMYERRSGKAAYSFVKKAVEYKKEVGLIGSANARFQLIANYIILVMFPKGARAFIYEKILRKKNTAGSVEA